MKCDICGSNKAVIHIQQIYENNEINIKICEKCARNKGLTLDNKEIGKSLKVLLSNFEEIKKVLELGEEKKKCSVCGTDFNTLKGKCEAGCENCYSEFENYLKNFYKSTTGNSVYTGKYPGKVSLMMRKRKNREKLEKDLVSAVKKEDYEKAAVLRDRIRFIGKYT
jgi:protein arginine kinase activator